MANNTSPPTKSPADEAAEISLDNIDEILKQEDPGFVDSLNDIKANPDDLSGAEIESLRIDDLDGPEDDIEKENRFERWGKKFPKLKPLFQAPDNFKKFLKQRLIILKGRAKLFVANSLEQLKTLPDRTRKLLSDLLFVVRQNKKKLSDNLDNRSRGERFLIFIFLFGLGGVFGLVLLNMKNSHWLPQINRPLVLSLETVADRKWTFDSQVDTIAFLSAFPQEKHNYLFPKVIVNLKVRPGSNAFTMGAFEFYLELDSKDSAIEVKSREVELHDLVQRVTEQFTYEALETERGKDRLKEEIKKSLNQKIVQGWVKDVYIKFFITKP
jgi:flagellar basal body-associated protein FliL